MSQENVEIVRRSFEAFRDRDFETWASLNHPDVEWRPVLERGAQGSGGVYRGVDGMREFWAAYQAELDDLRVELHDVRDVGDERVLFLGSLRWRGRTSGIEVESPLGMVFTVRNGKITHSVDYLSHEEALEAVRLRE